MGRRGLSNVSILAITASNLPLTSYSIVTTLAPLECKLHVRWTVTQASKGRPQVLRHWEQSLINWFGAEPNKFKDFEGRNEASGKISFSKASLLSAWMTRIYMKMMIHLLLYAGRKEVIN